MWMQRWDSIGLIFSVSVTVGAGDSGGYREQFVLRWREEGLVGWIPF